MVTLDFSEETHDFSKLTNIYYRDDVPCISFCNFIITYTTGCIHAERLPSTTGGFRLTFMSEEDAIAYQLTWL